MRYCNHHYDHILENKNVFAIVIMQCTAIDKLRQPKFLDMAVFDWVATMVTVTIIGWFTHRYVTNMTMTTYIILLECVAIVLAIVIHKVFGVPTMFNYYLGLNDYESVIAKRKIC